MHSLQEVCILQAVMKIKIIALGKIKEKFLKDGIDEFLKRLTPYATVEVIELVPIEIKDENLTEKILEQEGEKILALIKPIMWNRKISIRKSKSENEHV